MAAISAAACASMSCWLASADAACSAFLSASAVLLAARLAWALAFLLEPVGAASCVAASIQSTSVHGSACLNLCFGPIATPQAIRNTQYSIILCGQLLGNATTEGQTKEASQPPTANEFKWQHPVDAAGHCYALAHFQVRSQQIMFYAWKVVTHNRLYERLDRCLAYSQADHVSCELGSDQLDH